MKPGWTELKFICFLSFLFKTVYKESPSGKFRHSHIPLPWPMPFFFFFWMSLKGGEGPESCQSSCSRGQSDHVTCLLNAISSGSPVALQCSQDKSLAFNMGSVALQGLTSALSQVLPHTLSLYALSMLLLKAFSQAIPSTRKSFPFPFLSSFRS